MKTRADVIYDSMCHQQHVRNIPVGAFLSRNTTSRCRWSVETHPRHSERKAKKTITRHHGLLTCISLELKPSWLTDWRSRYLTDSLTHWLKTDSVTDCLTDFLENRLFASQKRSFSARLPLKLKLWSSKTKLFCETSFKNEALKLKNEAFLRDFLQKWSFEAQKRSFCARLPSKTKLWRSKTKHFCETSFKNWSFEAQKRSFCARLPSKMKFWSSKTKLLCETSFKNEALKLKNEAFVRDFLQKRSFEGQKRSFCARLPSKMKLWSSKTKHFCERSFKNKALKLKNQAFLRDFIQKCSFEGQKRSISARLPWKMRSWPDTWPQNSNTF